MGKSDIFIEEYEKNTHILKHLRKAKKYDTIMFNADKLKEIYEELKNRRK